MDSFELNKIAGAVLATGLLVMALSITSEIIYEPTDLRENGYVIAVKEASGHGGAPESAPTVAPIAVRLQTADVSAGEATAKKCQACHTFEKGGPAKVGPNLYGIVGNHDAHMQGFKYSDAMLKRRADGKVWTFEELDKFLTNPRADVPGTLMSFAGLKKPDERANVIAYLRTLSDSPVPLPEPPAAAAPEGGAAATGGANASDAGSTTSEPQPSAAPTDATSAPSAAAQPAAPETPANATTTPPAATPQTDATSTPSAETTSPTAPQTPTATPQSAQ